MHDSPYSSIEFTTKMHCIFQRYTVFFFFFTMKTPRSEIIKFAWKWRHCFINPRAQLRHEWFEIVQGTKMCLCLHHERSALSRKQARQKGRRKSALLFFSISSKHICDDTWAPLKKWRLHKIYLLSRLLNFFSISSHTPL